MSSWWSGCYGSGLILKQEEFGRFLVKYREWNHMDRDTDLFNEEPVREFNFVRSIYAGMNFSDSEKKGEDCFRIADVGPGGGYPEGIHKSDGKRVALYHGLSG